MHAAVFFRRLPALLAGCALLCAAVLFLIDAPHYAECIRDGISLWAVSVLPSAFPFLFFMSLFSSLPLFAALARLLAPAAKRIFRIGGEGACILLLSLFSGYPVGARLVGSLQAQGGLSEKECFRLACLCSTSGPAFLIGAVGSAMWRSPAAGCILFASHVTGVLLPCLVFRGKQQRAGTMSGMTRRPLSLQEAMQGAVLSVLCVGGMIAIFYLFGQMLSDMGIFSFLTAPLPADLRPAAAGILQGLLEMTAGCAALAARQTPFALAATCFLVTFGGLCALCQQLSFLQPAGIKTLPFLLVKLIQGILAAAVCLLLCLIFGVQ